MSTTNLERLIDIFFNFPTLVFTLLLILSFLYWLVVAIGAADIDSLDFGDAGEGDVSGAFALLSKFGLDGLPLTIVVTFLSFFGWMYSSIICIFVQPQINNLFTQLVFGIPIFLLVLYIAAVSAGKLSKPLRPIFITASIDTQKKTIGKIAIVRTGSVTSEFGEATVEDGGAGLIVKVRPYKNETFRKGDRVVLLEYVKGKNIYKIISENDFTG